MSISVMRTKLMLPFAAAGAMLLSSCGFSDSEKLHDYMAERGDTQMALDSMLNATKRGSSYIQAIARQSAVDSIAYRDLFNTTALVKDSAAIAELNKIAAKASFEKVKTPDREKFDNYREYIYKTACHDGISIKDAENLKKSIEGIDTSRGTSAYLAKLQAFSDKYFYKKFFKEKGLFADKKFANDFKEKAEYLNVY